MRKRLSVIGALAGPALAITILLGVGTVAASGSGPAYLQVVDWSASDRSDNLATLTIVTDGAIPRKPDAFIDSHAVVGLAWADLDSGSVFVTTIHPVLGRDSHQNPDAWHAHTATLTGGATAPNDFCIASIDATPTAGIAISGNTLTINVQADRLPVPTSAFDAAVGFTIEPDPACGSGLAVRIVA